MNMDTLRQRGTPRNLATSALASVALLASACGGSSKPSSSKPIGPEGLIKCGRTSFDYESKFGLPNDKDLDKYARVLRLKPNENYRFLLGGVHCERSITEKAIKAQETAVTIPKFNIVCLAIQFIPSQAVPGHPGTYKDFRVVCPIVPNETPPDTLKI